MYLKSSESHPFFGETVETPLCSSVLTRHSAVTAKAQLGSSVHRQMEPRVGSHGLQVVLGT